MIPVIFRPMLVSGMVSGKVINDLRILIDSEQSEREQVIALYHELIHLLFGRMISEQAVEAMALKLAAACPEILTEVKKL